jgi:hypothetical protein
MTLLSTDLPLLSRHARAIYHMRAQLADQKLIPVFGAGSSRPIGLPNWADLVQRLADHAELSAAHLTTGSSSQTSKVQLIFNHFKRCQLELGESEPPVVETKLFERRLSRRWREIVHECLYRDTKDVGSHPYLAAFVPLIRKAPLTVNYNFDDSLQELLDLHPDTNSTQARGFETIWEPTVQFRYRTCVIYHPNGFLPRKIERGPSPRLVFLEDSYADQLIDAQRGHYSTLLSHFQRFTSLLIGLSLDDPTLRHLLRQSATSNPGHVHYYVAFCEKELPSAERQRAVRESNFHTYNLVTIFLTAEDYGSLGRLLTASDQEFALASDQVRQPINFVYYLSGAVGSGKTTSLGAFKSLKTYDEWLEDKIELLHRASDSLNPTEKATVDSWINKQMRGRNYLISRDNHKVSIVDRSPLDPIVFSWDTRAKRARELLDLYENSEARRPIEGMVILLTGSPDVLYSRTIDRHKDGSSKLLGNMQERFSALWSLGTSPPSHIDTVDVPEAEVAKRISRVVHLDEYRPISLSAVATKVVESVGSEVAT